MAFNARAAGHGAEALECRRLLAFGPVGPEFRVNATLPGDQFHAAVGMDADGDFVVFWKDQRPAGQTGSGLYFRRFNAAGQPQGGDVPVPTTTPDAGSTAVAVDDSGDFVLAWTSGDASGEGVYAQRFNAAGVPQGNSFRVNNTEARNQGGAFVAIDADGDFVIAWTSTGQGPSGDPYQEDVFARRYSAAGVPRGDEFRVNTLAEGIVIARSVAMDDDGDFVVAWERYLDFVGYQSYFRRYNAAGVPQGGQTSFEPDAAGRDVVGPAVAMDADGDFVVVYELREPRGTGRPRGIYTRRFNAAGTPLGEAVRADTAADLSSTEDPGVAMDADGDFLVSWNFNFSRVHARRFNAAGQPQGAGDFKLHSGTEGRSQLFGPVAADADGDFVVVWTNHAADAANPDPDNVNAQRFGEAGGGDTVAPRVSAVFVDGAAWQPAFRQHLQAQGLGSSALGFAVPAGAAQLDELPWMNVNRIHVKFSEDVAVDAADLAVRGVNTASYALDAAAFAYDAATFTATWVLANNARFNNDKVVLDLNADAGGVTDKATPTANRLDGEWTDGTSAFPSGNGTTGGDLRFRMHFLPGDANRNGGVVNSLDVQAVRNRQFTSPASPGTPPNTYTAFHDIDGSAFINSIDVQQDRIRQFTGLPDGNPAIVAARASGLFAADPTRRRAVDAVDSLRA